MKINEVSKKTGLSKRTIYYYIEEQLISPRIDKTNGYNDFSEDDGDKLCLIQKLRGLEFSIVDIRSILNHPTTAQYLLQRQIEKLVGDYTLLEHKISELSMLNDNLPIQISYELLHKEFEKVKLPVKKEFKTSSPSNEDIKLVALYLWGTFLEDIPMTEYREFLWEKVQKEMAKSYNQNIMSLKNYLHSISVDYLDRVFANRNLHVDQFANMSEDNLYRLVLDMKSSLLIFNGDSKLKKFWKENYTTLILPQIKLFDSPINEIIKEMSPRFLNYHKNVKKCNQLLYDWLSSKEGDTLRTSLMKELSGFLNLDSNNHGELTTMAFFEYLMT